MQHVSSVMDWSLLPIASWYLVLGIVTGGDQQVSQDQQLVICELLLMLLPVVMVSPPKVRQSFLHSHLNGLGVIEVSTQVHQQLGHPGGHIIWARENTSTQPKNTSMAPHQVSRGYSVHYRSELPLPLLRQASLAQSLKMCLHGGVHGQEIALKEAAECGGGHFSYLQLLVLQQLNHQCADIIHCFLVTHEGEQVVKKP